MGGVNRVFEPTAFDITSKPGTAPEITAFDAQFKYLN